MKKKIFLILIAFICFHTVHAVDNATIKNVTTLESGRYFYKSLKLNNGKTGHFYHIKLDGVRALGIDLGKTIIKNDSYKYAYSIPQNGAAMNANQQVMAKAYYYAKNNGTDDTIKVAQIIVWLGGPTSKEVVYDNVEASERTIVDSIYAYSLPSGAKLSVWEHALNPGSFQKVLTDVKGETNANCEIAIDDNLPTCTGDSKSNYGFVKQTARGKCKSGFDKGIQNNRSMYGDYSSATTNLGTFCRMYCLSQFNEELPGNITQDVSVGRYIVWPNNNIDNNKYKSQANLKSYPMMTSLTKTCKISVDRNALTSEYNNWKTKMAEIQYKYRSEKVAERFLEANKSDSNCNMRQSPHSQCRYFWDKWQYWEDELDDAESRLSIAISEAEAADSYASSVCSSIPAYTTWSCNCYTYECNCGCGTPGIWQECGCSTCESCDTCDNGDEVAAAEAECSSAESAASAAWSEVSSIEHEIEIIEGWIRYWKDKYDACATYKQYYCNAKNVIIDFNNCINANTNKLTNGFNYTLTNPRVASDDKEYSGEFSLRETKSTTTCTACSPNTSSIATTPENISASNLTSKADTVESRNIVAETKKYYDLLESNGAYYYYIDKINNKAVHTKSGLTNYSIVGFSNIPISYNANTSEKHNLSIKINGVTGAADLFNTKIRTHNYTCGYKVTKISSECICPEGTKHAGESLNCVLLNSNMTCSDAKLRYCDSDIESIPHDCETDIKCLDSNRDLTSCVSSGLTLSQCRQQFCNGNNKCTIGCDLDDKDKWVNDDKMDITACVISMIIKGYTEYQSYKYCKDRLGSSDGIKIIYRTIDLNNPFPSKDADASVEEKNLKTGAFNETLRGRYPGSNWNSESLVKSKIMNNRDTEGDNIYKKEPLYSFTLNNDTIKTIRGYNQAQGHNYDDFNLVCLNNNSACKSSFVHNPSYGISGGSCYTVNKDNFYKCIK